MRRRKLDITGALLLLYVGCCHAQGWTEKPFLPPVEHHDNVTWVTCELGDDCAIVYLKENTEGLVEILRLNTDIEPEMVLNSNTLGLEIAKDDKSPSYFLRATQPGNYEAAVNLFTAMFSRAPGEYFVASVILENVNDNPPIIVSNKPMGECSFREETKGYPGCNFTVTDDDGSACYAEMTVSDDHFRLVLEGQQTLNCKVAVYNLEVIELLDYETFQLHSLEIIAVDKGQVGPNQFLEPELTFRERISYVVYVEDIPDVPPVWVSLKPSISIMEKENHLEKYTARDGDYGLAWNIKYSLQTDDHEYFAIDEDTGILSITAINRDELQREIFNLKITATEVPEAPWEDHIPESEDADIVVIVNDVNDNIPEFIPPEDYKETVDEEQPFSKEITIVEDPDLGLHGTFDLSITENKFSDNFIVVPATGYQTASLILSALDPSIMDYENPDWREIILEIVAQEKHEESHRSVLNVIITLRNLNDEYPVFSQETYRVHVDENRPKDFEIVTVLAEDPDEDDFVTYSIGGTLLQIDESTGNVTTKNDLTFDYEKQTEITLQVYADDQATPNPHRAVSEIIIEVQDLNDEAPFLDVGGDIGDVVEHSEKGTKASPEIIATDPDTTADLKITIDWEESVAYKQGIPTEKEIFMNVLALEYVKEMNNDGSYVWKAHVVVNDEDKFDWEKFEQVRLRINVEDTNTHADYLHNKYAYATIFINVGDINDQEPQFTEASSTVEAVENERSPRLLGSVLAIDLDGHPNNIIKYSIEPVFPEGLKEAEPQVEINEDTGRISTTTTAFDVEEFREMEYKYVIYATDGKFTNEHQLTVNITDVNDEEPEYPGGIDPNKLAQEYEEHKDGPEKLVCLGGHDDDMTDPYNHITYYITGIHQDDFHMDEDCFFVTNGTDLDREDEDKGPVRNVAVNMRDNFKEGIRLNSNEGETITIIVTLIDINDHDPIFDERYTIPVSEFSEAGILFTVGVTDEDEGDNARIKCSEKPTVNVKYPSEYDEDKIAELFVVSTDEEESTCSVRCTEPLRGFWGQYELTLEVQDHGTPPRFGKETYDLHVQSYNFEYPSISYPQEDDIIRISMYEDNMNWQPLVDYYGEIIPDFYAIDKDDPETNNGKVTFKWVWDCAVCDGVEYFDFITTNLEGNTIRLRKLANPSENVKSINGILSAEDGGNPSLSAADVKFKIVFIDPNSVPQFVDNNYNIKFTENDTGLLETQSFPEAENVGQEGLEDQDPIYYHIINGSDLFQLRECDKPIISLKAELDYEDVKQHKVVVGATNDAINCNSGNAVDIPNSQLELIVEVIDINDEPPRFVENPFTGVFRVSDDPGRVVVTLLAIDPDSDDEVSYEYVSGSISADGALGQYAMENAFVVDKSSGEIKLNFALNGRDLSGAFKFQVVAYDTAGKVDGHQDFSGVFVSIVSERHQVEFHFYDEPDDVRDLQNEVAEALTNVLGYKCSIERIQLASENSAASGARTDMLTHFLDVGEGADGAPVEGNVIAGMFLEGDIYSNLTLAMTELKLSLSSISKPSDPKEDSMTLTIVLAAVCAVLVVLVIVFSLAFVVRTRTLNQRLNKLTTKKFGSQDSGLNREGLAVPGTNMHALEGSNPVWNQEVDRGFDAMSESSGDSDLVGIEDSPEFGGSGERGGFSNTAFQHDTGVDDSMTPPNYDMNMRRASINPLAAASAPAEDDPYGFSQPLPGGDMDVPRRFSLNPLATAGDFTMDFGEDDNDDHEFDDGDGGASNLSYQSNLAEPTTEL